MNKLIKDHINRLKPSATLAINEESNRLKKNGKKIYKFGFGQSPFPIPESVVSALKKNANKHIYLQRQGAGWAPHNPTQRLTTMIHTLRD